MIVEADPFPHVIIQNCLSESDYEALVASWPKMMNRSTSGLKFNATPTTEFYWKQQLADTIRKLLNITGNPTLGRFALREPGYMLRPHIDSPDVVATVIHYLPLSDNSPKAGTVLYRAERPLEWGRSTTYFHNHGIPCTEVVTIPYEANTVLAFPNTPISAHGLHRLVEPRRIYQWHFRP